MSRYFSTLVKVVVVPLLALLTVFLGVFFWLQLTTVKHQRQIAIESAKSYMSQAVEGFVSDLLLNDQDAILLRIEYLRTQVKTRFVGVDSCIKLLDRHGQEMATSCAFYPKGMGIEKVPLKVANDVIGEVIFGVSSEFTSKDLIKLASWPIGVAAVFTFLTGFLMLWLIERFILRSLVRRRENKVRADAMLQTVQMIAHDLRRPFSLLQVVLDEIVAAENSAEIVDLAKKHAKSITAARKNSDRMLEDLLSSGRPVFDLTLTEINFNKLVRDLVADVAHTRSLGKLPIELIGDEDFWVIADEHKLERVIINILSNAVDAAGENGKIWIKWRVAFSGELIIEIGNLGSFIPPEKRELIFQSFYSDGKESGTGLGLFIAKRFVEAHGGRIWCASGSIGRTIFRFTLPEFYTMPAVVASDQAQIESTVSQARTSALPVSGDQAKRKILIVDDDQIYQDGIDIVFRKTGLRDKWELYYASSADEAMSLSETHVFDGCICDFDLGTNSDDGLTILRELGHRNEGMLKILHTNRFWSEIDLVNLIDIHRVSKPISAKDLLVYLSEESANPSSLPLKARKESDK